MIRSFLIGCCIWGWLGHSLLGQPLQRYAFSHAQMGTEFGIILYAEDEGLAAEMAQAAFDRVDELNAILSDYDLSSELSLLSETAGSGRKVQVSDDLWTILASAQALSIQTAGAFDISIGPLSKLWRRAFRRQEMPDPSTQAEAHALVNYQSIRLYPRKQAVMLTKVGMRLDLGGIAKGYAAEAAYRVLAQQYDHPIALVDAGGDLFLGTPPPGTSGWTIEWPTLSENGELQHQTLTLSLCAVATSGDTYRYLEAQGVRYSHLIDPRTGFGQTDRRLVSVIAGQGMMADAWASVASILSPEALQTQPIGQLEIPGPSWVQVLIQSPAPAVEYQFGLSPEEGDSFFEHISENFPADLMEQVLSKAIDR